MRLVPLLVLAACSKSAPPPATPVNTEPASNEGVPAVAGAITVTDTPLPLGGAGTCAVGGTVVEKASGEPLAGVTFVIGKEKPETTISDEKGAFLLQRETVPESIAAYYADLTEQATFSVAWCGKSLRIELKTTN